MKKVIYFLCCIFCICTFVYMVYETCLGIEAENYVLSRAVINEASLIPKGIVEGLVTDSAIGILIGEGHVDLHTKLYVAVMNTAKLAIVIIVKLELPDSVKG